MANENNKVITLMCERSADVNDLLDADGKIKSVDGLHAVKLPCSGMVQPIMIETALKQGAAGVIVCGCQIGDCYYREGNKMIRERLLGERVPTLKKATDRRRILALWLSRPQKERFIAEAGEFVKFVQGLPAPEPAAAPAAKPAPAAAKPAADAGPKTEAAKKAEATPEKKEPAAVVVDADGKVDSTKTVKPASEDSNDKDPKIEVEVAPIPEGRGPLEESSGDK
ncbi:MAG: hydrogenase iron-sulfur subunit [Cyanobacteria bacterium SZAS-4]|nr:hydrogenase iron-sulfur subunit [Cyanobacteria bacterium SZAS-4]